MKVLYSSVYEAQAGVIQCVEIAIKLETMIRCRMRPAAPWVGASARGNSKRDTGTRAPTLISQHNTYVHLA